MFSLNEQIIAQLNSELMPSYQASCAATDNLGFGFIFYGMARALRPKKTVVVGSKAGFSVMSFALGIKDNIGNTINQVECFATSLVYPKTVGQLHFIDPSFSEKRQDKNHWHGIGYWDDPKKVQELWKTYGVEHIVTHFKMISAEYIDQMRNSGGIDLLYIDGDHSYEGVKYDFEKFYDLLSDNAIVLAHDIDPRLSDMDQKTGGFKALQELDPARFQVFRLPVFPGLAIIRKKLKDE